MNFTRKNDSVSGDSNIFPVLEGNLSDISSDEEEQYSQTQQTQIPETPNLKNDPASPSQTDTTARVTENDLSTPPPPEISASTQLVPQINDSGENIQILLDSLANNLHEITLRTGDYNMLMHKIYDFIKSKYATLLPDEQIVNLRNFLFHNCTSSKPYIPHMPLCIAHKRKNEIEEKTKAAASKKSRR